jgi:hypothetical protein
MWCFLWFTHFNVKYLMSNICDASLGFHLFQCKIYVMFFFVVSFISVQDICDVLLGGFILFNAKYM